jgi:hypothetical protein
VKNVAQREAEKEKHKHKGAHNARSLKLIASSVKE